MKGRDARTSVAVQDDLRDKVRDVVRRLAADAQRGEFTRRLTAHALTLRDVELADQGAPHFTCPQGSVLRDNECGESLQSQEVHGEVHEVSLDSSGGVL